MKIQNDQATIQYPQENKLCLQLHFQLILTIYIKKRIRICTSKGVSCVLKIEYDQATILYPQVKI